MNRKSLVQIPGIALLLTLLSAMQSFAQQRTINDGVYTAAQAESGKLVYEQYCAGCHSERDYRQAWPGWENRTIEQLYFNILGEMPLDNPGFLSDGEYTDVIVYILSMLDYPAGDTALDPYDRMDQITIVPR